MCGFAGYIGLGFTASDASVGVLHEMGKAIETRGPDDAGVWVDHNTAVGLVHRRLSIVDLSAAGHQPMVSADGRFVLAYNGEIYNHADLRSELERSGNAPAWRGHSDTETLLAGFLAWGVQSTLQRCIGMFAFALWDREKRTMLLARDRLGEKPLYYGWQGSGNGASFLFGSELSALKRHPAFKADIDRGALALLMRHNCVPAPYSIYQGIKKLPPGCMLSISMASRDAEPVPYWSLAAVASDGVREPFDGSDTEAVDKLEQLLMSAIGNQMMADVPLGAFLSGGVDSSTVVALMQAQSNRPIKTFTIGFNEEDYDEAKHAKAVASHLGTEHTEMYVSPREALDVIPLLPSLYSEPFSDSSQIPTYLVSKLARRSVTVSLSGDAGDELFSGYNRYLLARDLWPSLHRIPSAARRMLASGIRSVPAGRWDGMLGRVESVLPKRLRFSNVGDKLHKGARVLGAGSIEDLYHGLVSHWSPESIVIGGQEPMTNLTGNRPTLQGLDPVQQMMALDSISYLPDDILVKLDRAAMGVSLEGRVPFLDHRVVEFAWTLPQSMKIRDGQTKWALRQVLYRHVPQALIERPKMGFGVPISDWLRGPLRDWAEALLDTGRLRNGGFFEPEPIRRKWEQHLSGQQNWQHHLWDVLMFQAWLEKH